MQIYVVKAGDTLSSVAQTYGVSQEDVIAINDLSAPDRLAVGQALVLPTVTHPYFVSMGETVGQIANRLGVPQAEIYADNPPLMSRSLLAGETILVRRPPTKRGTVEINGYAYPFIDAALLEKTLPYLTYLTIFSYGVRVDGTLVPAQDEALIRAATQAGVAPIMLLSTIGDDGTFNSEAARSILTDETVRQSLLSALPPLLEQKGYYGIDVDFEFIPETLGAEYAAFISDLKAAVAPKQVFVALAPKTSAAQRGLLYEAHDYAALGRASDRALIMTYEWGYTYGPPMAVAPKNEVRRVLQYGVSVIPPEKILMGLPNYAYDWPLPFVRGETAAASLSNPQAAGLAGEKNAQILFDERAASPYFTYTEQGVAHEVWFEDARSVTAKLELLDEFRLRGTGVWNIMRPFGQLWYLLDYYYDIAKVMN